MANTLKFGNGLWATKEGSTLAYNDENDNYKPLPFDFTRASSATVVNKNGLIETVQSGIPRIDFQGNTNGALLLEPQRTNLLSYSESFLGSSGAAYLTDSDEVSPDGSINGFKISEVSTNSYQSRIYTNISYVSGNSYTMYVFAKASTNDRFVLFGQTTSQPIVGYDLTNGTILTESNVTSSFIDNYGNGWYRCGFTYTSTSTQTSQYGLNLIKNGTTNTYLYNGDTNKNILFYGAQLEQGSYPTSYIPTSGQSGGVTRVADVCNNGGNDQVINSTEGVLYAEIAALANDGTYRQISLTQTASGGDVITLDYSNTSNEIRTYLRVGAIPQSLTYTLSDETQYNKIAVRYKDTHSLWVNGLEVASQALTTLPINLNVLTFDNGSGVGKFYGKTKALAVYDTALTDEELQALTQV